MAEARYALDRIRDRTWTSVAGLGLSEEIAKTAAGRELIGALIHELESAVPRHLRRLPEFVIRQLVDDRVRTRLGLSDSGLLEYTFTRIRFTDRIRRNRNGQPKSFSTVVVGPVLRIASNLVTQNSIVHFIGSADRDLKQSNDQTGAPSGQVAAQPPFVIPGMEEWVAGIR